MNFYKHYSFDLWMTLIKSNPSFKTERARFFHKNFNSKKKTVEEIISIFRQVDLMCNAINERTGKNIDSDEMHLMVISMMNDFDISSFANIDLCSLYNETEAILFNYMPEVYSSETLYSLDKLRQANHCTFNISSNTAFVRGKTLRKVLTTLELAPFFDFQLYSDEIGISKPDRRFFERMLEGARGISSNKNIALVDIVHVGDNPIADIAGALSAGIPGFQINSNEATITNLLN